MQLNTPCGVLSSVIRFFQQQPWLLDYDSEVDACLNALKELNKRLVACAATAEEYRAHQRTFKV